ncbi:MAG TPA: hypothetical protein VK519_10040, partial [Pinirhizobacter sp.]|nr:hypothetical protein [Pinirhizobacter sp.]
MSAIAKVAAAMLAATVALSGQAIAKPLAIVNAHIYPSPNAPEIRDGVVLVQDGKIVKVGTRSKVSVPKAARVIDAHGAVLTAGFWNSHVHIMPLDLMSAKTAKAEALEGSIQAMLT